MKSILQRLFVFAVLLLTTASYVNSAHIGRVKIDGICYELYEGEINYANVTRNYINGNQSTYSGDIIIPEAVNSDGKEYSVTSINSYAFKGSTNLKSVSIPNTVTEIGSEAFRECAGLSAIAIPNSVTSIGSKAFFDCTGVKSVTIGMRVLKIGSYAFGEYGYNDYNQYDFVHMSIPKVIWLPNTPPEGVEELEGIINYVANEKYTGLPGETKVYKFLSSMFEVDGMKYVPVSPSDRTCDAIDFSYNEALKSINIGNTVSYNGISMTVQDIRPYTCYDNDFIGNVTIDCAGSIGKYAFYDCDNIELLKVKAKSILSEAFIESMNGNPATAEIEVSESIEQSAFKYCSLLESVTLKEGVKSIGEDVFHGCRLKGITIPNSMETLGSLAFSNCSSLEYAIIGSGVKSIGNQAFKGCRLLPKIEIPKNVESIGNGAFSGCGSLASVTIADRETELSLGYNDAFDKIDYKPMFSGCPLKTVYIGGNITYPTSENEGYSPFYRNKSLETVTITDEETEISENEFYGCSNLKTISIGDGVESIGNRAFSGCASLDSFTFGAGMKTIGEEAFSDCGTMTKLISKAAVPPTCGIQALDDINKWNCKLQVPDGSIESYKSAEQWKEFFFIEGGSGVESVADDGVNVEVADGKIIVGGTEEGQLIEVCGVNGLLVYEGSDTTISLPEKSVYIVRVAGKSFKVAM